MGMRQLQQKVIFLLLIVFALYLPCASAIEPSYYIAPIPEWTKQRSLPESKTKMDPSSGEEWLLIDRQQRVTDNNSEKYVHVAKRILNASGINANTRVAISYDPSYQTLAIHSLQIRRGDKIISQLNPHQITVLRREQNIEQGLIDGEQEITIILNDIRTTDIIEYSYTISGKYPASGIKESGTIYLQSYHATHKIFHRLLVPSHRKFKFKKQNTSQEPRTTTFEDYTDYEWEIDNAASPDTALDAMDVYQSLAVIEYSEYNTWREVIEWALIPYATEEEKTSQLRPAALKISQNALGSKENTVSRILQFVQNDIRYTGLEMGAGGHIPRDPQLVLENRYGDCKDKTLLLVSLLRALDIEAYPAFVNTNNSQLLLEKIPSPYAFDHAIAKVIVNSKVYWLDPTHAHQGGKLESLHQPNFGYALVIGEKETELTPMKSASENWNSSLYVHEYFDISQGRSASAKLKVETRARGAEADRLRSIIAESSKEEFKTQRLEIYSSVLSTIKSLDTPLIEDDFSENIVDVTENYEIPSIWKLDEAGEFVRIDLYAMPLQQFAWSDISLDRKKPFQQSHPLNQQIISEVSLDSAPELENENIEVVDNAFKFTRNVKVEGTKIVVSYNFATLKEQIAVEDIPAYVKNLEKLRYYSAFTIAEPAADSICYQNFSDHGATALILVWLFGVVLILAVVVVETISLKNLESQTPNSEAGELYYPVSILKFVTLSILTFNLYLFFWFYKNWRFIQLRDKSDINPQVRAFLCPIFCAALMKDLHSQSASDSSSENNIALVMAAILSMLFATLLLTAVLPAPFSMLSLLSGAALVPTVMQINFMNGERSKPYLRNSQFNWSEALAIFCMTPLLCYYIFSSLFVISNLEIVDGWYAELFHRDFLVDIEMLDSDESIDYFYGSSFLLQEEGNFLTNKRVASYWREGTSCKLYRNSVAFHEIKEIKPNYINGMFQDSTLTVRTQDGGSFNVLLSSNESRARKFVEKLEQYIATATKSARREQRIHNFLIGHKLIKSADNKNVS